MKVLLVSTRDIQGGAARATYRLHTALRKNGILSTMLVQSRASDDPDVVGPVSNTEKIAEIFRPLLDSLPLFRYPNRTSAVFSPARLPLSVLVRKINLSPAELVHLHWICGGLIRLEDLAAINKPIVWSLHDMWPFTGGCHYDGGCGKYVTGCMACPVLGSQKKYDLSKMVFSRKRHVYQKIKNLTVVGLSSWISACARQSALFSECNIINLPNPIDTSRFYPISKDVARKVLNLPLDKRLILYGAESATSDPRKGYRELLKALFTLDQVRDIELVVFGGMRPNNINGPKHVAHYLGQLHDDVSLQLLYSASDVMVVPSLQENLSNAIMESLACGTPVVGFKVGGNKDLIDHMHNGYLAEPLVAEKLADGINWVLNSSDYASLSRNARNKVLKCFDEGIVASRYIDLYKNILDQFSNSR